MININNEMQISGSFWHILAVFSIFHMVFPDMHFGYFYPQNLVPDAQELGARVLSDDQSKTVFIYLWIRIWMYFWFKKARIIYILAVVLISLKQQTPES